MLYVPAAATTILRAGYIRLWNLPGRCHWKIKRQIHSRGITGVTLKRCIHSVLHGHAFQHRHLLRWNVRCLHAQSQVLHYFWQLTSVYCDNWDGPLTGYDFSPVRGVLKNCLLLLLELCRFIAHNSFIEATRDTEYIIRLKWCRVRSTRLPYGRGSTLKQRVKKNNNSKPHAIKHKVLVLKGR